MAFTLITLAIAAALFLGMLLLQELGRRLGCRHLAGDPEGARKGLGAVEGAVFGLMGLLLAFTFSGAASRLEGRRQLIAPEVNAIGTAYLRIDLLGPSVQAPLREAFRQYLDARLAYSQNPRGSAASRTGLEHSIQLQQSIWSQAVVACQAEAKPQPAMLLVPAINDMIDITTTRGMALEQHPPAIVFGMLAALMLVGALLAGYGMAERKVPSWAHILGFAALFSITFFVILDLEYPRLGLIRVDGADQVLVELRASMK